MDLWGGYNKATDISLLNKAQFIRKDCHIKQRDQRITSLTLAKISQNLCHSLRVLRINEFIEKFLEFMDFSSVG
ncbi:hypothetical protein [Campylobacter troglodytis]|uniref:hypothetical protein n=1 Tax=Campylobacter troglodytis TaxID=654363 RepID=UPI00115C2B5A|nr:hypothetical protein [Campylobacter troglodytis]